MEKKKLKLSIKGSSQKTFSSIEQAKSKSKNTVVIEKKSSKFHGKSQFSRTNNSSFVPNRNISSKPNNFSRPLSTPLLQILKKEN
jgi:translation initiation factor IF-2